MVDMSFSFIPQIYAQGVGGQAGAEIEAGINLGEEFKLGASSNVSVADVYKTPADMVNLIANNLFILGGIFFFLMVIYAGFKFIKEDTKAKEEGKKIMKTAIAGFLVMFSAYWIVQIVKVITGANIGF